MSRTAPGHGTGGPRARRLQRSRESAQGADGARFPAEPPGSCGPLTAVSLFAGIGGFDLACRRTGITVTAAAEIDPACREVLARHFPAATLFGDIAEVTGDQLRQTGFDPGRGLICAGWPCQGNSVAGRRTGMADPRSALWQHVMRLLAATRARWLVGENVPGLLAVNGGRDFATIVSDLDDLGYGVAWRVLDARWFGLAQRRRRVFIVGCLGDGTAPVEVLLEPGGGSRDRPPLSTTQPAAARAPGQRTGRARTAGTARPGTSAEPTLLAPGADIAAQDMIAILVAIRGRAGGRRIEAGQPGDPAFAIRTPGGSSYPMVACSPRRGSSPAAALATSSPDACQNDRPAPPVTANRNAHGTGSGANAAVATATTVRRLTPRECERLQGFPDGWTSQRADRTPQSDSARYRQLGNAVPVPVARWIIARLAAADQAATAERARS